MQRSLLPTAVRAQRPTLQCRPNAILNFFTSSVKSRSSQALTTLLTTIQSTSRGLSTSPQQLQQIKACFDELESAAPTRKTENGALPALDATWRLLWTTEKETLFILKNAGVFGTAAGEVYQVVDTAAGYLGNVIEFPPEGAFVVDSSIQLEGERRVNFRFTAATLRTPTRSYKLPPFGQGWFDNVYVDGRYRLSKDVRGDYLVVVKDGPPRRFL